MNADKAFVFIRVYRCSSVAYNSFQLLRTRGLLRVQVVNRAAR
jgi:hypothetical protein